MPNISAARVTDFISQGGLAEIQSSLAAALNAAVVFRHPDGRPAVSPAKPNAFAEYILSALFTKEVCVHRGCDVFCKCLSDRHPRRCGCLPGLCCIVAPIYVSDELIAVVEVGPRPDHKLSCQEIAELAGTLGLDETVLREAAGQALPWSEGEISAAEHFLNAQVRTMASLCRRGLQLQARVRELSTLSDVASVLTSTLDLSEVLNLIVKTVAERLNVKAATIRLFDRNRDELVVRAVHNLSAEYLSKGPVHISRSKIDQEALKGRVVYIADVRSDGRVIYRAEATREGLRSGLSVGLVSKNVPVGVLRVYTGRVHEFSEDEVRLFKAMADQAAVAIENARLYSLRQEMRHIQTELAAAAEVQNHLLPTAPPRIPDVDIAMTNVPCEAVGGDLYDFVKIDETTWGFSIADVAGKGIPGAIVMASVRSMIRGEVEDAYTVSKVVRTVNRALCRDATEGQFVTLFFATYDASTRRLRYTNAGHCEPILIRSGEYCFLEEGGLPLGLVPEERYEQAQAVLRAGDIIVAYTDGLVEAMSPDLGLFSRDRVLDVVRSNSAKDAKEILAALRDATAEFCKSQKLADDMTVVVIKLR